MRASSNVVKVCETAARKFASTRVPIEASSRRLRPASPSTVERIGELTAYVSAKAVTSRPAVPTARSSELAISGRIPAMTKVSVPMAKAPAASQIRGDMVMILR
jgi:hypothetical protein